jgi:pimeloyl-ACP methyl ester carboxylesterase
MITWQEYHSKQIKLQMGETYLSFREYGSRSNETLVCIHGIPTWGYIFHDLAETLSENYHVLVPDLLGYGFSDKRDNFDRAIDKQAANLIQWMNELDIEKTTLIGHDIGGGVAQRMVTTYPDRVNKLCLMNSISYDSWPIELMIQMGHPSMKKLSPKIATTFLKQALKQGFYKNPSKDVLKSMIHPWTSKEGFISLIRNAASLNTNHTTEITHRLPQIKVPTLIIWGKEDKFQSVSYARRLNGDIQNSKLTEVKNAKHWVMLDRPDIVHQELMNFLNINLAEERVGH